MRKYDSAVLSVLVLLAGLFCLSLASAQEKMVKGNMTVQEKPLYTRLGGYDAIAAVVDDFLGRLVADPQITRFFTGASTDSKNRIRQLVVDQLCAATGGPCVYIGRSMKSAHAGLGITEGDWQASVNHLVATLEKFKVPQKEKDEVLAAISGLKGEIVEKP